MTSDIRCSAWRRKVSRHCADFPAGVDALHAPAETANVGKQIDVILFFSKIGHAIPIASMIPSHRFAAIPKASGSEDAAKRSGYSCRAPGLAYAFAAQRVAV